MENPTRKIFDIHSKPRLSNQSGQTGYSDVTRKLVAQLKKKKHHCNYPKFLD